MSLRATAVKDDTPVLVAVMSYCTEPPTTVMPPAGDTRTLLNSNDGTAPLVTNAVSVATSVPSVGSV